MVTTRNKKQKIAMFQPQVFSRVCAVASAIIFVTPNAIGADWKFLPTINIKETYSDNIGLQPPGSEKSDFVTQIAPGFSLTGIGSRLKLKLDYRLQNLIYASEKSKNSTFHQLNGMGNLELVEDLLFIDGRANISQQNISAFSSSALDNTTISDNRTNVRTTSISPYLVNRFGNVASSVLRYTHETVDTSKDSLLAGDTDRVTLDINSGSSFRKLGWGFQFSDQNIDHKNANSVGMTKSTASLRYLLTDEFALTGSVGYEKNDYFSIKENPEGASWSTGFSWKPSERTSIAASAGKRFYGDTYSLAASHRARHTFWNLSYGEDITTTQSQFTVPVAVDTFDFFDNLLKSAYPDANQRRVRVDEFIRSNNIAPSLLQNINLFSNSVFLQKSLQASVGFNGARNTVLLNMFNTSREAKSDQFITGGSNFTQEDKTKQLGANALWSWRLSPITSANFNTSISKTTSFPTGRKSILKSATASISHQLSNKTSTSLELRRQLQSVNKIDGDFQENAVSASLVIGF